MDEPGEMSEDVPCASSSVGTTFAENSEVTSDSAAVVETKPPKLLRIDVGSIPAVPLSQQADELKFLGIDVYDQTQLEEGVMKQVDEAFEKHQREAAKRDAKNVAEEVKAIQQRLRHLERALEATSNLVSANKDVKRSVEAFRREKDNKERQLKKLKAKQRSLTQRIGGNDLPPAEDDDEDADEDFEIASEVNRIFELQSSNAKQEELIRTGQMTPFGTMIKTTKMTTVVQPTGTSDFDRYLLDQAKLHDSKKKCVKRKHPEQETAAAAGDANKPAADGMPSAPSCSKWEAVKPLKPEKTKKRRKKEVLGTLIEGEDEIPVRNKFWSKEEQVIDLDEFARSCAASDSDYVPSSGEEGNPEDFKLEIGKKKKSSAKNKDKHDDNNCSKSLKSKKIVDDGNQKDYLSRLRVWQKGRLKETHERILNGDDSASLSSLKDEYEELDGGFKIPLLIWNKLYKYQKTCVQWLWELHVQRCGGIIGDEMGLGKTIQVIAFFAGLWNSNIISRGDSFQGLGPVLIITPTTIMHQWVKEFHTWWPPIRVGVLHDTGSYSGTKESLIRHINSCKGVLVMSYTGVTIYKHELLRYDWHYIVLDEGHKIRNPDAQITLAIKQFRTPHRLILSGSPLQNNLKELWSLFDYIFPGKLGTLPVFMQQFSVPITLGGYANATDIQVQTAYRCATVLRDTIGPYLLRRMKVDVKMNLNLPTKNEQVLFCRLTDEQRCEYKQLLDSDQIKSILSGRLKVFVGLIHLRKICNHPDLYSGGPKHFGNFDESLLREEERYGYWKRSGKMIVIESILKLWHTQNHRVLLFTQSRQMLKVLEYFIKTRNYSYMKMDGTTSISSRQPLINQFNNDSSVFIFLLTTRVGGLGVNLTGADRVIIFDPDWNPSTDLQARERAWRIGQNKNVTIYRLLTSGTIEEKIYHRQIFKQFLTNRVLKDPRQRRFFKNNDLYELFTLKEEGTQGPESLALFAGTGSEIKVEPVKRKYRPPRTNNNRERTSSKDGKISSPTNNDRQRKSIIKASDRTPEELADKLKSGVVITENVDVKDKLFVEDAKLPPTSHGVTNGIASDSKNSFAQDDDGGCCASAPAAATPSSIPSDKLAKMKELAKQLSQQIANKYKNCNSNNNATDGNASTGDTLTLKLPSSTNSLNASSSIDRPKINGTKERKKSFKKKRRDARIDGEKISYLDRHDKYRPSEDPQADKINNMKQDEYVLQKLFAKSGVHSALRHDVIVEGTDPDYYLVEREADRVAKDAVLALKKSRRSCFQADSGIPNWTGSSQTRPTSAPKLRFGQKKNSNLLNIPEKSDNVPKNSEDTTSTSVSAASSTPASSSQLLAKLRERQISSRESDEEGGDHDEEAAARYGRNTQHDELLGDIRTFISFQSEVNGQATTDELLRTFRHKLPPENSSIFKSLLKRICDFHRDFGGQGVWTLRADFR